jgi:hypothetical protein
MTAIGSNCGHAARRPESPHLSAKLVSSTKDRIPYSSLGNSNYAGIRRMAFFHQARRQFLTQASHSPCSTREYQDSWCAHDLSLTGPGRSGSPLGGAASRVIFIGQSLRAGAWASCRLSDLDAPKRVARYSPPRSEIALAAAQAVWSLHNRIYDPLALWGLGRTVDICEAEI